MTLPANIQDIEASLRLFAAPDELGEVRVIGDASTCGFYFRGDEISPAAQLAATMFPAAKGIYVVMNRIDGDKEVDGLKIAARKRLDVAYKLTENDHIDRRRWVLIDFDPNRPTGVSATADEKETARVVMETCYEYLQSIKFPEPIFADSGNGWHMLFRVDLPADDGGLTQAFLKAQAKKFTTDAAGVDISVHNAARITKLYGTPACKGENTADRPHRLSKLLSVPDEIGIVSAELLQAAIDDINQPAGLLATTSVNGHANGHTNDIIAPSDGFHLPETAGDGSRHDTLKSMAAFIRTVGATENEIYRVLQVFNQTRCSGGGKPDSELQSLAHYFAGRDVNQPMQALLEGWAAEDADKAQRHQRLKLLLQDSQKKLVNGGDFEGILNRLSLGLAEVKSSESKPVEITALSAAELDAGDFPLTYLIEDILVQGQPCIVAAPKKSLKTNCMIDMALSLASRSKFLNEFYVPTAVRVALISGESGKATIQETARRIARSKPWIHLRDYENAFFGFDLPKFGDEQSMKALQAFIERHQIKALVVDPAYLCIPLGDDAGNLFRVGEIILPVIKLCEELGVTLVIVHHFVKAAAVTDAPPELENIAWAGFQELARQWVLMSRRSKYDADRTGHHELWFTAGGSAGHSVAKALDIDEGSRKDQTGRRWEVSVKAVGEAIGAAIDAQQEAKDQRASERDQRQLAKDVQAAKDALKAFPAGLAFSKLRDESGVRGTRLKGVIAALRDQKAVEDCIVVAANKQEYDGLRLVTRTHSDALGQKNLSESAHITRTDALPVGERPSVCVVSESKNGVTRTKAKCPDAEDADLKPNGKRKPKRKKPAARKASA